MKKVNLTRFFYNVLNYQKTGNLDIQGFGRKATICNGVFFVNFLILLFISIHPFINYHNRGALKNCLRFGNPVTNGKKQATFAGKQLYSFLLNNLLVFSAILFGATEVVQNYTYRL